MLLFVLEDDDGHVTTAPKNAEDIMDRDHLHGHVGFRAGIILIVISATA